MRLPDWSIGCGQHLGSLDFVGNSLSHHDSGSVEVPTGDARHDGRIHHAKIVDAWNTRLFAASLLLKSVHLSPTYMRQEIAIQSCRFVCTGKFKCVKFFDHICMHICKHICMQICKPIRCKSVSYLYHILKGIKYISVQISSISGSCPDFVLIQGFKMWSKLPTHPEREGTSS